MITNSHPPAGTCVAIIAPGGYAADENALPRAIAALRSFGCIVKLFHDPAERHLRFGGSDETRIARLHAAAADPEVDIVLALRGGYGMSRLLPAIDFQALAASGKLFVGHSDFTAFHLGMLARTGAVTFAGPMVCDDFSREEPSAFTLQKFWRCVSAPACTIEFIGPGSPPADLAGTLWGGNLTMVTHLLGTPYFPTVYGGILFLEDVNEHPYRVERMLLQLWHAGVLARQKAIVLGDFSAYRLSDYDNGYDFDAMLRYLRETLGLPVWTGLPFGHTRDKVTLPVGGVGRLVSDGESCRLEIGSYPSLGGGVYAMRR
ncbi:muramoyltetrapeptide carboxypeptidase [Noviherbaspirillum sp.]|uniref:muramoyltetrapeptide carboxypeptidase n=1 Tax=Noviherbaspirillum sp. TaxID=1926288 RepID=UPI002FE37ED6